ncbi:MAG: hypothetical protein SFW08_05560 [Gemmatimonadaceae bacterium]|nr:hypothetical protein [Gemmatimonadaceae bacterium]
MTDSDATRRTPAPGSSTVSAGWRPNPRRILWPFLLTLVVVAGTWTPPGELRDAATRDPVVGMRLVYSDVHIWFAPWFDLLDTLSILTLPQHWAVLGSVILAHAVARTWRVRRRGVRWRTGRELLLAAASIGGLLLVYATALLVPRPMARLVVFDPDVLVLDVHGHTTPAHDGRSGFTPWWQRRWLERAGFHAAYLTDHLSGETRDSLFRRQREAMAQNPPTAGRGVVLLPGAELRAKGQPVTMLSMSAADTGWVVDGDRLAGPAVRRADGHPPVLVHKLPSDLSQVAGPADPAAPPVTALEMANGDPRGLAQALREHDRLVRVADSLDLALVSSSSHHGWGSTAAAWTLMRLPGWHRQSPESLAASIEATLRTKRRLATRVVERRTPELQAGPQLLVLVPLMLYELNATLSPSQRLSWICWIWALFHFGPLVVAWFRGRRVLRSAS